MDDATRALEPLLYHPLGRPPSGEIERYGSRALVSINRCMDIQNKQNLDVEFFPKRETDTTLVTNTNVRILT